MAKPDKPIKIGRFTIRERHRRGYVREAQGYTAWTEWQVVDGRKVVGRHDFREQAERQARQIVDRDKTFAAEFSDRVERELADAP